MLKIEDIATKDYERVVVFRDDCGFFCCIAIHHTKLGPALGGCRIRVNTLHWSMPCGSAKV